MMRDDSAGPAVIAAMPAALGESPSATMAATTAQEMPSAIRK
jgi:hypothetical protein